MKHQAGLLPAIFILVIRRNPEHAWEVHQRDSCVDYVFKVRDVDAHFHEDDYEKHNGRLHEQRVVVEWFFEIDLDERILAVMGQLIKLCVIFGHERTRSHDWERYHVQ